MRLGKAFHSLEASEWGYRDLHRMHTADVAQRLPEMHAAYERDQAARSHPAAMRRYSAALDLIRVRDSLADRIAVGVADTQEWKQFIHAREAYDRATEECGA
jgi:hypothetical protein